MDVAGKRRELQPTYCIRMSKPTAAPYAPRIWLVPAKQTGEHNSLAGLFKHRVLMGLDALRFPTTHTMNVTYSVPKIFFTVVDGDVVRLIHLHSGRHINAAERRGMTTRLGMHEILRMVKELQLNIPTAKKPSPQGSRKTSYQSLHDTYRFKNRKITQLILLRGDR